MRFSTARSAAASVAALALLFVTMTSLRPVGASHDQRGGESHAYLDNPPLAHTGGFGEPTCRFCHAGSDLNVEPGTLSMVGLPDAIEPGSTYTVIVELRRPELAAAGFELAIRDTTGVSYGALLSGGAETDIRRHHNGVDYAFHTLVGTNPISTEVARWAVRWKTPDTLRGDAVLSITANAANGDNSEFGDAIYQTSVVVPTAGDGP